MVISLMANAPKFFFGEGLTAKNSVVKSGDREGDEGVDDAEDGGRDIDSTKDA